MSTQKDEELVREWLASRESTGDNRDVGDIIKSVPCDSGELAETWTIDTLKARVDPSKHVIVYYCSSEANKQRFMAIGDFKHLYTPPSVKIRLSNRCVGADFFYIR
jgi:hypothetical protein